MENILNILVTRTEQRFFLFYVLVFEIFMLLAPYVCFHIFS